MSSPVICLATDCPQYEYWQVALLVAGAFAVVAAIGLCITLIQRRNGKR